MSGYLSIRCPKCGNQFPTSFKECIYCRTDLRDIEPSEYEPLDMTPIKTKPKKRFSIPRIKKWEGYEESIMDATPETLSCDVCGVEFDHEPFRPAYVGGWKRMDGIACSQKCAREFVNKKIIPRHLRMKVDK